MSRACLDPPRAVHESAGARSATTRGRETRDTTGGLRPPETLHLVIYVYFSKSLSGVCHFAAIQWPTAEKTSQ